MTDSKRKNIFYIDSSSWRVPALLALIVFALSFTLKFHFYYIHLYLVAASVISLCISYLKYAELTDESLTIYTGAFRQKLNIDFDQIDSVKPEEKDVKGFTRIGPMGAVPYTFEIEYILISLLTPLEKEIFSTNNNKQKSNIFDRKFEVTKDGKGIILYKPPRGGFRPFLNSLSDYVNVLNLEEIAYERKYADILIALLNVFLFGGFILLAIVFIYQTGR